ncbi:TetR/AcrR family transcriptional regulator C-terminal domain-containing protein [soil metagenome]|jgi:AcrR family transcriptional regulator
MPEEAGYGAGARAPLNRERVVRAAVTLADEHGIEALTMRRLGSALGVEAMSLYNHIRNKEDLLDGMVDYVFSRITLPQPGQDWREGLRVRSLSAREVLGKHRWAVTLMDSRRSPGAARLRHDEAVLGGLREGGFSVSTTARALVLLDSFVYGFALTEASLEDVDTARAAELSNAVLEELSPASFPHLFAFYSEPVIKDGYDFRLEFEPSLNLILGGLEKIQDETAVNGHAPPDVSSTDTH